MIAGVQISEFERERGGGGETAIKLEVNEMPGNYSALVMCGELALWPPPEHLAHLAR